MTVRMVKTLLKRTAVEGVLILARGKWKRIVFDEKMVQLVYL